MSVTAARRVAVTSAREAFIRALTGEHVAAHLKGSRSFCHDQGVLP